MTKRTYNVWCPGCAAEWLDLSADDSALRAGEAVALARCDECLTVSSVVVRQPAGELTQHRRQLLKTVQKICQSFVQAQTRLDERRRTLAREVHEGNTEQVDQLRDVEARIASLKPPDVSLLEERARKLGAAADGAPSAQTDVSCPNCTESATVFRETRSGYEVPCPRCTHKLVVKLRVSRD